MRFQDHDGPLGALGIFRDGQLVAAAPDDQQLAYELLRADYPGLLKFWPAAPNIPTEPQSTA